MAEWLILLLLVPVIVAPVVLVLGFAGCRFNPRQESEPTIDATTGTSFNTISVAWGINGSASVTFQRTNLDNSVTDLGVQPTSPFTDTVPTPTQSDQNPPLVYQYQADNAADSPPVWSAAVSGKTFELTFDGMLAPQNDSGSVAQGVTVVQRIESAYPLTKSGTAVQLLLQASASLGASIDAIFISQADPNQPMQPWQPANDLNSSAASRTAIHYGPWGIRCCSPAGCLRPRSEQTAARGYQLQRLAAIWLHVQRSTAVYADRRIFHSGRRSRAPNSIGGLHPGFTG